MKSTSVKGLPGAKSFTKYTGNVKSSTASVPKGDRKSPAGGKVKSNLKKPAVRKKLGGK